MAANPDLDLVTLEQAKEWLPTNQSVESDNNIQACISAVSIHWLWKTGQGNPDGSIPAKSPFTQVVDYTGWYDGNGGTRMFVRNVPIVSVSSLTIDGTAPQQSLGAMMSGWVIDSNGKSIALRGSWRFNEGVQNIYLVHRAGFASVPEDIQLAALQIIALNYKKRNWVGQQQVIQPEVFGTVMYRDWDIPPEAQKVIWAYARKAIV